MKRYCISYTQGFLCEVIEHSYIRSVSNEKELHKVIDDIYDDPHVIFVNFTEIADEIEKGNE